MDSAALERKPTQRAVFQSAREACRHLLRSARTASGRYMPLSIPDMAAHLAGFGFAVSDRDIEGFLRELAGCGEAVEIDAQAGFRWSEPAA